jgi:putative restriction endonuclease
VRELAGEDFATIVLSGLRDTLDPANAMRWGLNDTRIDVDTAALIADLVPEERRTERILLNRKVRDANFRRQVCEAYQDRCAVTGLRLINGGGKSEVQAAHIWPVAAGGPDTVQNGVALSATAHWLFDRHLISFTDDYALLVSHNRIPSELMSLFSNQLRRINLPANTQLWPSPAYVKRHREEFLLK